jgi:hypothetical protein
MASREGGYEPRVLVCLYDLTVWMMRHTNRFPKNLRVTLGDRLDGLLLDLLSLGQRARLARDKAGLLQELSDGLESLRMLVRLSGDLGCLDARRYEHAAREMDEIGRQVGGWLKQQRMRRPRREDLEEPVS